jgi:hypothetical protein
MSGKGAKGADCCSCSSQQIAADLFIAASVIMICIVIVYFVGTFAYQSESDGTITDDEFYSVVAAEVLLLFAGIMYLAAASYLHVRTVNHNESYKTILEDNYKAKEGGKEVDCCTTCCTANTYLVVGWLVFLGTIPLILYPVPVFPFIMVALVIFIILFMVAVSPPYLAMNKGKGSLCYVENGPNHCCNNCCNDCCRVHFFSDVATLTCALAIFGIFFLASAIVNFAVEMNDTATAWMIAAILLVIGLFYWYMSVFPPKAVSEEEQPLRLSSTV